MKLKHLVLDLFSSTLERQELEIIRTALADYQEISADAASTEGSPPIRLALLSNMEIAYDIQQTIEKMLESVEQL